MHELNSISTRSQPYYPRYAQANSTMLLCVCSRLVSHRLVPAKTVDVLLCGAQLPIVSMLLIFHFDKNNNNNDDKNENRNVDSKMYNNDERWNATRLLALLTRFN